MCGFVDVATDRAGTGAMKMVRRRRSEGMGEGREAATQSSSMSIYTSPERPVKSSSSIGVLPLCFSFLIKRSPNGFLNVIGFDREVISSVLPSLLASSGVLVL